MKITFIRHAESTANAEKIIALDSAELSAYGLRQAEAVGRELKEKGFEMIIASPIRRALDTAEIISKNINVPVVTDDLLAEKMYGSLSGKSLSEADDEKMKNLQFRNIDMGYDYRYWGGESGEDIKQRILTFAEKVKANYGDKKILAVSHGGIIRMMHILFLKKEYKEFFPIPNVSVHEFEL